ncbi:hypothetical protein RhiirA5_368860 [Rhizophagus irregularis]|uniref:Uncharacterized protein n=1 Tax=Rhizophagus irregularis TaxID=588596 RepID=A0A2N0QF04_9GLOM|nr:hypothetical protein RhiirA5_368860 [Rhizophagus irregularis]
MNLLHRSRGLMLRTQQRVQFLKKKSVFPDEFREETKECLEKWRNIIINKHETEENFYGDPILIIEYNDAGLTARNIDSHAVAQGVYHRLHCYCDEYVRCSEETWDEVRPRPLIPKELPTVADLAVIEYNRLLNDKQSLNTKWRNNWAKGNKLLTDEDKSIFDCVQIISRNL